jgi:hypothetical protein
MATGWRCSARLQCCSGSWVFQDWVPPILVDATPDLIRELPQHQHRRFVRSALWGLAAEIAELDAAVTAGLYPVGELSAVPGVRRWFATGAERMRDHWRDVQAPSTSRAHDPNDLQTLITVIQRSAAHPEPLSEHRASRGDDTAALAAAAAESSAGAYLNPLDERVVCTPAGSRSFAPTTRVQRCS